MTATLAHAGHWYHAVLYLAPVLLVALLLWAQGLREKRRSRRDGDERDET